MRGGEGGGGVGGEGGGGGGGGGRTVCVSKTRAVFQSQSDPA